MKKQDFFIFNYNTLRGKYFLPELSEAYSSLDLITVVMCLIFHFSEVIRKHY